MKLIYLFVLIIGVQPLFSQSYTPSSYPSQTTPINSSSEEGKRKSKRDSWLKMDSLSIYGAGSLYGLVSASEQEEGSTSSTGSLGFNFSSERLNGNLFFSYNGKKDIEMTSIEQFGLAIMNPNQAGQAISFSLEGRLIERFGVTSSFLAVDNNWQLKDSTSIDSSPYQLKVGTYLEPFDFPSSKNTVRFIIKLNYTHRGIFGDFGNSSHVIDGRIIEPKGYNGVDFSTNLIFNNVELFFQLSHNSKEDDIPGFSGPQVVFGLNVAGNLIKL